MATIGLVIKGGIETARQALTDRQIYPIVKLAEAKMEGMSWGKGEVTLVEVPDRVLGKVVAWFTEQGEPPFAAGTLLFYKHNTNA